MAHIITGNHVARLHELADSHGCTWVTSRGLPVPFWADPETGIVHVDGRLPLLDYYAAVLAGVTQLANHSAQIIPLRPRRDVAG